MMFANPHMKKVEEKRAALDAIPMWRPIKRQNAGRELRWALYDAAVYDLYNPGEPYSIKGYDPKDEQKHRYYEEN